MLGIPHVVRTAPVDESMREGEASEAYLERIARAKLDAVRGLDLGACTGVLVADTIVVAPGGRVLGKPKDDEEACVMIERLAGATHDVSTRFLLASPDAGAPPEHAETVTTRVAFRPVSREEARAYAATGEGRDKAGAYGVQGAGGRLRRANRGELHQRGRVAAVRSRRGDAAAEVARREEGCREVRARLSFGSQRSWDRLLVFAVAMVARLAVVAWAHGRFPASEDGHYYDTLARRLASGAGYTWAWPDGAITYAAHYPVGYPALLALAYALFGASAGVAMTMNALLGAASAVAAHRLVDDDGVARWRPLAAGLAVALHPALVPYTAAVMTEGATTSLLLIASAFATRARFAVKATWPWILGAAVTMGVATLVRPQSLLLAPVLGALALRAGSRAPRRLMGAVVVTAVALACVAPWTARNCVRMHRCALVSVNGGWNLLIGAQSTRGAWEPVAVPSECATVWDEAGKDACFERAAVRSIVSAPGAWLARAPAKVAATLDYFGAAPWYLHASGPAAFGERGKIALAAVETVVCRLFLLAALVVCGRMGGPRRRLRQVLSLMGAAGAITLHAWFGYLALAAGIAAFGHRALARLPLVVAFTSAVVLATAGVHAAFFGSGRYGLVVVPFVTALACCPGGARGRPSGQ